MTLPRLSRRALLQSFAATGASVALSACGQNAPVDEQGRVRLRLAVPGPARADHAGFYQAIASGAYARRGLNVQIFHGNTANDVSARLASGNAELGLAKDSFAVLRMVTERAPVKAVAAYFQKDPRVLIAHAADAPRDLGNLGDRPLFIEDADWSDIWSWLQTRYNLSNEQLQRPDEGALQPFLDQNNSLLIGSLTRDPAAISVAAPDLRLRRYLPADDGYASYSSIVLAPNAFARDNTEALRNFIAASVEGWHTYLSDDPEPAHALIRRANPATPQGSLEMARDLLISEDVVTGGDTALYGLGAMTAERWQAFAEQSRAVFSSEVDWRAAYTTDYLPTRK